MRELYLNNQICDIDEEFKPTFQFKSFLFAKMKGFEAPRTWETSIPLTARNRSIIYQSQSVDVTSSFPYITHTASYYSNGYPVFESGKSYMIGISGNRANLVFVLGETIQMIKQLNEVKLNELTESPGDFLTWDRDIDLTTPLTSSNFGWANWYSYTNEDRSLIGSHPDLPYSTLHPVVKFGWILDKISSEFGITINGLSGVREYVIPIKKTDGISILSQGDILYDLVITEYTNDSAVAFTDVILSVDEPLTATYGTNTGERIRLTSSAFTEFPQQVRIYGELNVELKFHGIETDLLIWVNGLPGTSGSITATDMSTYWKYEFDVIAELSATDYFTINFEGTNIAEILSGSFIKSEFPDYENKSLYLQKFFIVPNLPDITCAEFLNQCCMLSGRFPYVDESVTNVINFYSTKILYDNVAQNWSKYLVKETDTMGQAEDISFSIDGFNQRNLLKYAEDETNTLNTSASLDVENTNIDLEADLFKMYFGAAKRFSNSTNVADYPLYDVKISDGKLSRTLKNKSISIVGAYDNVGGINYIVFPDDMKFSTIKTIEPYQYYQAVIKKPKVLKERFILSDRVLSLIDVRTPIYLEQYGQYFAILEAQINANYEADVTLLQLPVITPITVLITFAAYDDTNVEYYLNSAMINPAGETFELPLGSAISITAVVAGGYTAALYIAKGDYPEALYIAKGDYPEALYYMPYSTILGVENLSIRGDITATAPLTTDVIFEPYSWLNGAFSFKNSTVNQAGETFRVLRGSSGIISCVPNKGFTATLNVDKGLGAVPVSLPYTLTADVGEVICYPEIVADSSTEDKTITIAAYDEPFGIVYIKINDVDYPVSPAGATFTLAHGKYFYLFIVPIEGYTTSIDLGGGVVINEEYYEDILITNMSFSVVFLAEEIPSTVRKLTVSPYDISKGALVVYIPSVVTHYVPAAGGVYEFNQGDRLFFSISPADGYEIDKLIIDGLEISIPFNSYDKYINDDMTLSLTFKAVEEPPAGDVYLKIYDPSVKCDIYVDGVKVSGYGSACLLTLISGTTVEIEIVPFEGYKCIQMENYTTSQTIGGNVQTLTVDRNMDILAYVQPNPTGTLYTRYVYYPIKS